MLSPSHSSPALPVTPVPLVSSRRSEARTHRVLLLVLLITVQIVLCIQVASHPEKTLFPQKTFFWGLFGAFLLQQDSLGVLNISLLQTLYIYFLGLLGACLLQLDSAGVLIILLPQTLHFIFLSDCRPNSGQIRSPLPAAYSPATLSHLQAGLVKAG